MPRSIEPIFFIEYLIASSSAECWLIDLSVACLRLMAKDQSPHYSSARRKQTDPATVTHKRSPILSCLAPAVTAKNQNTLRGRRADQNRRRIRTLHVLSWTWNLGHKQPWCQKRDCLAFPFHFVSVWGEREDGVIEETYFLGKVKNASKRTLTDQQKREDRF